MYVTSFFLPIFQCLELLKTPSTYASNLINRNESSLNLGVKFYVVQPYLCELNLFYAAKVRAVNVITGFQVSLAIRGGYVPHTSQI
jgi:hypothetical protein